MDVQEQTNGHALCCAFCASDEEATPTKRNKVFARIDGLLPQVHAHVKKEEGIRATNKAGNADPERFNALLRKKGCPV